MGDDNDIGEQLSRDVFRLSTQAGIQNDGAFARVILVISTGAIALSLTVLVGREESLLWERMSFLKVSLVCFAAAAASVIIYHICSVRFFLGAAEVNRAFLLGKAKKKLQRAIGRWGTAKLIVMVAITLMALAGIVLMGVFLLSNLGTTGTSAPQTAIKCPRCGAQLQVELRPRSPAKNP